MNDNLTDAEIERILRTNPKPHADTNPGESHSAFVRVLSAIDRRLLRQIIEEVAYDKGDLVFREGDQGDALYLIWSGRAAVIKGELRNPDIMMYRGPGEVVGEMALLNDMPRSASLVAVDQLRMLRISRDGFHELIAQEPMISISIMAQLSNRLRDIHDYNSASTKIGRDLQQKISTLRSENADLLASQRSFLETNELIVHDLRNPLGNMYSALNMLDLVLPEEVLGENKELLEIARGSLMRMQRLVDSLLDVSRLENRSIVPSNSPVNLRVLIADAIAANKFALREHGLEVQMAIPEEPVLIWIDETLISRVLINLIENAIKYTLGKEPLRIEVEKEMDQVCVAVEDNGPGIPEDKRPHVFERFVQGIAHGRRPPGYGLGLAYCRLAVEAHDGQIWIETPANGRGSRLVFTLPLGE